MVLLSRVSFNRSKMILKSFDRLKDRCETLIFPPVLHPKTIGVITPITV